MLVLKPGLVARTPDWIVAEYVHTAPHLSVLLEGVGRFRLGVTNWSSEHENRGQQQR
jgi:hypothetical protein